MATAPPTKDSISGSGATPSNAQAREGFGAVWENLYGANGLLGSTGLQADARNGLGIGSVLSFRNLVINGNFAINQRVYASGAATTAANQYTLDRWRVVVSGQSITFGAASPDRVVTAPAGGMEQVFEGVNMVGGVYTLSWVGTATATVNGAAVTNGGQTAALTAGANATLKFSGGTVDRVQFELGTVATPFERRPFGLELMLCQRYFSKSHQYTVKPGTNTGLTGGGEDGPGSGVTFPSLISLVRFPVPMRTASPSILLYDAVGGLGITCFVPGQTNGNGATPDNLSERGFKIFVTLGSLQRIFFHWIAEAEL